MCVIRLSVADDDSCLTSRIDYDNISTPNRVQCRDISFSSGGRVGGGGGDISENKNLVKKNKQQKKKK